VTVAAQAEDPELMDEEVVDASNEQEPLLVVE
jgi:hypothetical protein